MKLVRRNLLYYSRGGEPTPPAIELPPSNQIWYESTSKLSSYIGSPVSHTYDSETGRGVLTYDQDLIRSSIIHNNAFKGNYYMTKIWWPACCTAWQNDCMHSCNALKEIYAGSDLNNVGDGTCSGGVPLEHIYLVNNENFYNNDTGLVKKSNNVLQLGTVLLDIRNTPCTTIGSRCMADLRLQGCTIYFPDTVTSFAGDYNIGTTSYTYTLYFYSTTAPTKSHGYNIMCNTGTQIHIPIGSLSSYQTAWASLNCINNITFVEDL